MTAAPLHARLPPSSAYRWTTCTASIRLCEENAAILPRESSEYADEGTRAHSYLTARLKHSLGQVPDNPEMEELISAMVKYVDGLRKPGDVLLVDQRVPLFYLPTQKGTLDVALVGPDRIVVIDLKYGAGVGVYAERNKQLAIYAESQIRGLEQLGDFSPELPVTLVIYQPRDRNDPTVVREWRTTRGELSLFCETEIGVPAQQILAGDPGVIRPGEACKFCPAMGICHAYATQGLAAISDEPVDVVLAQPKLTLPSPETLTRPQRQRIIAGRKVLEKWLEAVENQEVVELMAGAEPIDFKLVEGKSNRQWTDAGKAEDFLRQHLPADQVNPPSDVISPAQAEKLLKKLDLSPSQEERLAGLITKPEGKPTLAPVTDKRPALLMNPTAGLSPIIDLEEIL